MPEFPRVQRETKKIPGFFSKTYVLSPPVFFSGIAHSKTIDLNWSYEALAQKEALTLCQDRAFASFLCVLSLASVLGRFTHLYCDNGSLGRGAPLHGKKSPLFPLFSLISNIYICCENIIAGRGKSTALQHFINCF